MPEKMAVIVDGASDRTSLVRRASDRTSRAVTTAALELLDERGYEGLNFDAVAARAQVAKTTIYRWWPSKATLVLDLIESQLGDRYLPMTLGDRLEMIFGPDGFPALAGILPGLALDLRDEPAQLHRLRVFLVSGPDGTDPVDPALERSETSCYQDELVETYCGRLIFKALFRGVRSKAL